jgi:hypothetical protein
MPCNPFHRLQSILGSKEVTPEIAVRALMATVYSESCHDCNEKLRNEEFLSAFERMVDEMLHVQALSSAA